MYRLLRPIGAKDCPDPSLAFNSGPKNEKEGMHRSKGDGTERGTIQALNSIASPPFTTSRRPG